MHILGISCYYHDAAACLLRDGDIIAAAEEERFSRDKHDKSFPTQAVSYCLDEAGISIDEVDYLGFYEKPIVKFDRILETFLATFPRGFRAALGGLPLWIRKRLWVKDEFRDELGYEGDILFGGHHRSHAASAFYPSPFESAAILTVDGVGEWHTTTAGTGSGNQIDIERTISFPHSLGLLYASFTSYLGFEVNNGEYKVMGLSSYGEPRYEEEIRDHLIDIKADGSFRLNLDHFTFQYSPTMIDDSFVDLLGHPVREPEDDIEDHHFDIAASLQTVTEDVLLKLASDLHDQTGEEHLCMAGGVALNSVANGRLLEEAPFEDIWIQPAAGDDGGALGVAMDIFYQALDEDRKTPAGRTDRVKGTYLGPAYSRNRQRRAIDAGNWTVKEFAETQECLTATAERLADGDIVGVYQGRMEWGPRALGNRSILADPRNGEMQDIVNRKIKFREEFRPFAPSVLADHAEEYFDCPRESPYMLFVFDVHEKKQSEIPAVTHTNGTSRIQTVNREVNPTYYALIEAFHNITDVPVVLNTSLNRRGEPIVNTPEEAAMCFSETAMDTMCFPDVPAVVLDDE